MQVRRKVNDQECMAVCETFITYALVECPDSGKFLTERVCGDQVEWA